MNDPMSAQIGGTHYKGDKIQHFTLCMENNIPWGESAAIKYLMRHRKKNGVEDLDKAIHYTLMVRSHCYPDAPPFSMGDKSGDLEEAKKLLIEMSDLIDTASSPTAPAAVWQARANRVRKQLHAFFGTGPS